MCHYINGVIQTGRVSVKNPVTGRTETSSGIGDLILAPASTFHKLNAEKRLALYADFFLHVPVGDYKKGRLANMGTNQFSAEWFLFLVKGWQRGNQELYTEIGVNYLYNWENNDEHFRPGDMGQIQANLALKTGQLTLGLTARHTASLNEDKLNNQKVADSKVKLTEIGTVASYQAPSNKYRKHTQSHNHSWQNMVPLLTMTQFKGRTGRLLSFHADGFTTGMQASPGAGPLIHTVKPGGDIG